MGRLLIRVNEHLYLILSDYARELFLDIGHAIEYCRAVGWSC
jgi:hypothetical protein